MNEKCIAVRDAQVNRCPYNCSGKGVCNSKGHCHCDIGYAPPFCNAPGPGGSEDSGPASDPVGKFWFRSSLLRLANVRVVKSVLNTLSFRKGNQYTSKRRPSVLKKYTIFRIQPTVYRSVLKQCHPTN